jgi:hypothetical protein
MIPLSDLWREWRRPPPLPCDICEHPTRYRVVDVPLCLACYGAAQAHGRLANEAARQRRELREQAGHGSEEWL